MRSAATTPKLDMMPVVHLSYEQRTTEGTTT